MKHPFPKQVYKYIEFPKQEIPLLRFSYNGGVNRLRFHSKDLWYIDIPEEFKNWITLSETEGKEGSYMVKIETPRYTGEHLREGFIILNCWDEQIYISLIQYPEFVPLESSEFRNYLLEMFDKDGDGKISQLEANKITSLNVSALNIRTLDDIQYMPNLSKLFCSDNQLTTLDVSKNTALKMLSCNSNKLQKIYIWEGFEKQVEITKDSFTEIIMTKS